MYLDKDVYECAINRINFLLEEFDEILVWVSGGKDSTVIFNMVKELAIKQGRKYMYIGWIDQEAEWQHTVEIIKKWMYDDFVKPIWVQVPMRLSNATCTRKDFLECWNEDEKHLWMREKDPIARKENVYGTDRFHKLFDGISAYEFGDKNTCCIGGLRTSESPARFRSITAQECYRGITWGKKHSIKRNNIFTFYPIYDWSFTDVWKAIYDNDWEYNKIYDYYYQYGLPQQKMRVSNLHHEVAMDKLFYMQEIEPETHNRLCNRLEGIKSASQFGEDNYFVYKLPFMFKDWKEYRDYLLEKLIKPEHQELFRKRFHAQDLEFEDEIYYKRCLKTHVQSILANDWESGVKMANFQVRNSDKRTVANRKRKQQLEVEQYEP